MRASKLLHRILTLVSIDLWPWFYTFIVHFATKCYSFATNACCTISRLVKTHDKIQILTKCKDPYISTFFLLSLKYFNQLEELEEDKVFALLKKTVGGALDLTEASVHAKQMKGAFVRAVNAKSWEEAQWLYPEHTTAKALRPFSSKFHLFAEIIFQSPPPFSLNAGFKPTFLPF